MQNAFRFSPLRLTSQGDLLMTKTRFAIMLAALAALAGRGDAHAATMTVKASADAEIREQTNTGSGTGGSINSRYLNTGANNETMAYRFDLTGVNRATLSGATLNLINHRDNTSRVIHAFGVADGATGVDTTPGWDDNTWAEATVIHSTMPGIARDNNNVTQDETGTDLGTLSLVTGTALKGTANTFTSAAITTFLQTHADDIVTILVRSDTSSSGQARMATREATSLDGGSPAGVAGDFAAYLQFDVPAVPEPSSAVLLAMGGMLLGFSRRR
jgi:hypothetical protein